MEQKMFMCQNISSGSGKEKLSPYFIKATDKEEAEEKFKKQWGWVRQLTKVEEDIPTEEMRLFKIDYFYHNNEGAGYGCDKNELYNTGYIKANSFYDAWKQAEKKGKNYLWNKENIWPENIQEVAINMENLMKELLKII